MHEHDVVTFLLAIAVLLGGARLLGEGARALGLPLVVGEIASGILLGATGLGRVAPGQPVMITWDALAGASWTGTVEKTPTEITALGTRQVGEVLCTIQNTNGKLAPGANVNVEIQTSVAQNALTVPKEAIRRDGSRTGSFVLEGDRVRWRDVQVGVSSATRSQVVSGLKEGESVALTVDFQLKDGDRVEAKF